MSSAIEHVVNAHVRGGNREALRHLLDRRQSLAAQLRNRADFNFRSVLDAIDDDISAISAGLELLRPD